MIHRIHPMAKMITTILFLVVVISFDKYNVSGLIPFFAYPILLMALGDIPYRSVLSRLLIALPFAFLQVFQILFWTGRRRFYCLVFPFHGGCYHSCRF